MPTPDPPPYCKLVDKYPTHSTIWSDHRVRTKDHRNCHTRKLSVDKPKGQSDRVPHSVQAHQGTSHGTQPQQPSSQIAIYSSSGLRLVHHIQNHDRRRNILGMRALVLSRYVSDGFKKNLAHETEWRTFRNYANHQTCVRSRLWAVNAQSRCHATISLHNALHKFIA